MQVFFKFILPVLILAMVFQNCTKFTSQGSSDVSSQKVMDLASQITSDFFWTTVDPTGMTAPASFLSINRLQQTQRWMDSKAGAVALYPPLGSTNLVSYDRSPTVQNTNNGPILSFGENQALTIEPGEFSSTLGQAYSVVIYINNLAMPTSGSGGVRIFEMPPADGSASGYLGLDVSVDTATNQAIFQAYEWYDGQTAEFATVKMDASLIKSGLGIAIRFSNDPTKMRLNINGNIGTLSAVGTVPMLGNVTRVLSMHGPNFGQYGSFLLAGFALWLSELSDSDVDMYGPAIKSYYEMAPANATASPTPAPGASPAPSPTPGSGNLTYASISSSLQVCAQCHSVSKSDLLTNNQYSGKAWVIPGDPANSPIIWALNGTNGAAQMPKGMSPLSSDQITAIQTWIQQGAN